MKIKYAVPSLFAVAAIAAGSAQANTTFPTVELPSPSSIDWTFNSTSAGAATLDFQLQGYNSLDGDNSYIDIFHLVVNGNEIYTGTFNLGGGGTSHDIINLNGATWINSNGSSTAIGWAGGTVDFSAPIMLTTGPQTVTFSYESPLIYQDVSTAGPQGLGDEGWGINKASVTAVPEPQTYAMLLAGLCLVGFTSRKSKQA